MDIIKQLAQESILPATGEILGRVSIVSWAMVKVAGFLSLANVNLYFTIAVSAISFIYIALKSYDVLTGILEKRKKNQKSE